MFILPPQIMGFGAMIERTDEYFRELYEKGIKNAVLVCNSANALDLAASFRAIASEVGLTPIYYLGASRKLRESNVDNSLRDDFFPAKTKVLCFGPYQGGSTPDFEGYHWVLPEIRHLVEGAQENIFVLRNARFSAADS